MLLSQKKMNLKKTLKKLRNNTNKKSRKLRDFLFVLFATR